MKKNGLRRHLAGMHPFSIHTSSPYPGTEDGRIPDDYGRILDPFVALARASAVTSKIELGTGICLIPERNPLMLAKEVATLDKLSGGRFILGIGAGWLREETEIMGGDFDHRWGQTKDAVLAMKELWTTEESEYHGKYYDFPAVRSFPKPARKPHPPVYMGGSSQYVFKRIVEWGDGWMPVASPEPDSRSGRQQLNNAKDIKAGRQRLNELAEAAGRDPKSIQVMAFSFPSKNRTRQELDELRDAGVDHVTIWLQECDNGEAAVLGELDALAKEALD